jgi:hypothetical protein
MLPSFDLRVLLNGVDTHYLKKCVSYRTTHFGFNVSQNYDIQKQQVSFFCLFVYVY